MLQGSIQRRSLARAGRPANQYRARLPFTPRSGVKGAEADSPLVPALNVASFLLSGAAVLAVVTAYAPQAAFMIGFRRCQRRSALR